MNLTYDKIREESKIFDIDSGGYTHLLIYKTWRFFYSLKGDRAPLDPKDSNNSGIADYIELMLYKFETAKILLEKSFGLRDPLKEGFFYEQGVKFIDIYIKNIPREHGIASGLVYDDKIDALDGSQFQAKSLKITIHKNLIKKTATPIHELFHIFQYSYTHFNNMWFMEGLARWSQSIMQEKTGTLEPLPQTKEELDILVHKLHDAEFFFNKLITLCEDKETFEIPSYLKNNNEIYNNKKTGSSFMKVFLQNCEIQYKAMQKELKSRDIKEKLYWSRDEKRSTNNNQYIFKAVIDTVDEVCKNKSEELVNFIDLIYPLAHIQIEDFNKADIQAFLKVIHSTNKEYVLSSEDGILYSEFFDIFTGTFSSIKIDFTDSSLSDEQLETFKILKRINGALILKNCKNLTTLNGLRNLVSIDGDLILTGTNLTKLNELNNLVLVNKLHIAFMDNLESISGFNELVKIKSNLLISNNKNLSSVKGFNSLISVANIEILKTNLTSCEFLKWVFNTNKTFNGYIKICDNNLENIDFMHGVERVTSSLFLHQNNLENLKGLEFIKSIGGSLSLSTNKLKSIKSLSNLEKIAGLLALSYNNLESLDGLQNLKSLETKKWGDTSFTLKIYGNKNLKDISALNNIVVKNPIILMDDKDLTALIDSKLVSTNIECFNKEKKQLAKIDTKGLDKKFLFNTMGSSWEKNINNNEYFDKYFLSFIDIDNIIKIYKKSDIEAIIATTASALKFLNIHREALRNNNINTLSLTVNDFHNLNNKDKFYNSMMIYGFQIYIPKIYTKQEIVFPAIVKESNGSGGENQYIAFNHTDLKDISHKNIIAEYIVDTKEYATNILFHDNEIIDEYTYEKYSDEKFYILGQDKNRYSVVKDKYIQTPFLDIFKKILTYFKYEGFCCIDYKIQNGIPKIFEINTRIGFTHTKYKKNFFNYLLSYSELLKKINIDFVKHYSDNGFDYYIKKYYQCYNHELKIFEEYSVKARGSHPKNLTNIVMRNSYLGFVYKDKTIIGIAGIKVVPESKVFSKAGIADVGKDYPFELGFIYIIEEYRDKGIFKLLINQLLEMVHNKNIFLVTKEENALIINYFSKLGFRNIGEKYGAGRWKILVNERKD